MNRRLKTVGPCVLRLRAAARRQVRTRSGSDGVRPHLTAQVFSSATAHPVATAPGSDMARGKSRRARRFDKVDGMRFGRTALWAALALSLVTSLGVARGHARQKSRSGARGRGASTATQSKPANEPASELARLRAQLVQATKDYKSSLEKLLAL